MVETIDRYVNILEDNWSSGNTGSRTPAFFNQNKVKRIDTHYTRKDAIGVFRPTGGISYEPNGLGYGANKVEDVLFVNVMTSFSDAQSVLMRDEVKRILDSVRTDRTSTLFDVTKLRNQNDRRDSTRNFFRWELEYDLLDTNEVIV